MVPVPGRSQRTRRLPVADVSESAAVESSYHLDSRLAPRPAVLAADAVIVYRKSQKLSRSEPPLILIVVWLCIP